MAKIKLIIPKCLLYFSPKLATTQPFVQNMLTSLSMYVILHSREILNNRGQKASDAGMVLFPCICRPIIKGGATSSLSKDGISQQPINKDGIQKSVTTLFWNLHLWRTRLEICRDRRDRWSCKIFVSCVNFSKKQRGFLLIWQVYTHLNANFIHNC